MDEVPGLRYRVGVDFWKERPGDMTRWVAESREAVGSESLEYVTGVWDLMAPCSASKASGVELIVGTKGCHRRGCLANSASAGAVGQSCKEWSWYNGEVAVMARNRECEVVLFSDQAQKCAGSSPSPPENLVSTVSRI